MDLKEKLAESTKEELLELARSFELRKYSGLKKNLLIDKIATYLCSEEIVRSRLACLTKEEMNLYRKACIAPTAVSINEVGNGIQLYLYRLGYFEDPTDDFCVFEDVANVFRSIDDESFRKDNVQKGWLMKCIHFFVGYYGIAPVEVIYEMFNQRVKCTLAEMIELVEEMWIDTTESVIMSMDELGMQDWPKDSPLYSDNGLLVHIPLLENDELVYLLHQQMDKDFFIPSRSIIDEIARIGYEASDVAYKRLEVFLIKKLGLNYEMAVTWCLQVWANSYAENAPTDIIERMTEADISFNSEKILNEFIGILMNAHNNTRMKENRGHKPHELSNQPFKGGMPTIVPGSSHAAEMLKEAGPQLQTMGFPIDINGGAETIQTSFYPNGLKGKSVKEARKIYPNDPCPCGSGKKYKKCCGK